MGHQRHVNKSNFEPPVEPTGPANHPVTIAYGECEVCGTRFRRPEKNATCRHCGASATATTHRSTRWVRGIGA